MPDNQSSDPHTLDEATASDNATNPDILSDHDASASPAGPETDPLKILKREQEILAEYFGFEAGKPSREEIVDGGRSVIVRRESDGVEFPLFICLVPRKHLATFGTIFGKEWSELQFYIRTSREDGITPDIAEDLDDESYNRVVTEGRRLNFTRYDEWRRRHASMQSVINGTPEMKRVFEGLVKDAMAGNLKGSKVREAAERLIAGSLGTGGK